MFHHVSKTSTFHDRLKITSELNAKYDYFNFDDMVMKEKATTGSLYITLMNDTFSKWPKKKKPTIIDVVVLASVRINFNFLS